MLVKAGGGGFVGSAVQCGMGGARRAAFKLRSAACIIAYASGTHRLAARDVRRRDDERRVDERRESGALEVARDLGGVACV